MKRKSPSRPQGDSEIPPISPPLTAPRKGIPGKTPEETAVPTGFSAEALLRSTPGFLMVLTREGRILAANRTFENTFGKSVGRLCHEVTKGRDKPCFECPVQETFRDGLSHSSIQDVVLPGGGTRPVLACTSPVLGPDGQVEAVVDVATDISPMRVLEDKLRQSRERFRLLFEEVPCYISVQDRELRIVQCNRRFQEDFGSYIGAYCYEVYKHRGEPCLNCPVARTFQDGEVHQSEELVVARDGRTVNTLVSAAPIRNARGEIDMVMEMSTNITEIRHLQSQLANLGLLVGSVSHGIKGLLTGLDGGMYLLDTGIAKGRPERVEEGWKMVRRNVETIRSVVLDLLYVAKEREPAWECVPLATIARAAADAVRPRAQNHGIGFETDLDEVGPCQVEPSSLRAGFINLLENAMDACRIDRVQDNHRIRFMLREGDGCAVAVVEDNGVGMDRETREKLFTPFFSSKGLEGTGLGLYIAHKVILKHGGTLEVESAPGKGTRFSVRLPMANTPQ